MRATKVKVGGRITSPGIRIGGSSKLLYSQIVFSGAGSREIGFRDEDAKLDYKIPVELTGGIAFLFDNFQLEGDVRYHGSASTYTLLSSTALASLVTTDANGVPTESTLSFVPVHEKADPVLNLAIGGHYLPEQAVPDPRGVFHRRLAGRRRRLQQLPHGRSGGRIGGSVLQLGAPLGFAGSRRLLGYDRQSHRWSLPGWDCGRHQDQSQLLYHAICDFVRVLIT